MQDGRPWTRAELRSATHLSASTISSLVASLIKEGRIIETSGPTPGTRGRPSTRLVLVTPSAGPVLGIALGHQTIDVMIAVGAGEVVARRRGVLKMGLSASAVIAVALSTCDELLERNGYTRDDVRRAAVSIPAPINPATGLVPDDITIVKAWRSSEPARLLAEELGCSVTVVNDANSSALAECREGLGVGLQDFLYIECTRGLGAAIVINGVPFAGVEGRVGEIGHIAVPGAQKLCVCGKYGCLESQASTSALAAKLREIGLASTSATNIVDVIRKTADNSAVARLLHDAGLGLGRVIANMCDLLAPQRVVLGGDLNDAWEPLRRGVEEAINRYALVPVARKLDVRLSELGQSGPALGAVAIAITDEATVNASGLGATAHPTEKLPMDEAVAL